MKISEAQKEALWVLIKGQGQRLVSLRARWEDEKAYEDFREYEKVIRECFRSAAPESSVLKITKAFRIHVRFPDLPFVVEFRIGRASIGWFPVL
jgi:hypothetical protein